MIERVAVRRILCGRKGQLSGLISQVNEHMRFRLVLNINQWWVCYATRWRACHSLHSGVRTGEGLLDITPRLGIDAQRMTALVAEDLPRAGLPPNWSTLARRPKAMTAT